MAETTTTVAQITCKDESGRTKSFNLDYPKENLTLNQIKAAFAEAFQGRWLLNPANYSPLIAVDSATYATSTRTEIRGETVEITPSALSIQNPSSQGTSKTGTVTVTGGTIKSVSIGNQTQSDAYGCSASFSGETITVSVTAINQAIPFGCRASLFIGIEGASALFEVPITVGNPTN